MKRLLSLILSVVLLAGLFPFRVQAAAPLWPENISIQAEGGIVMDADTGTVIFGKNIHTAYYPASITKILTALIVIERCDLDEMVTFSHNAVYNVESGSSSAGLDEGDVLSVRDCLYALLLKSANEAANALAEHVAGTTESFAELMNVRAASLGCQDSHFANPSGLNDPNHYTSAYDMALIGRAALENPTFMEIDSTLYYDLPVTKRNKEGLTIYPGHKMIKKNMPEYYSGALGGKTGYTSLAGNTLVTFASRDGMNLVAVVLNGHSTHYSDTKTMLNFGFRNFLTVPAADFDKDFTSIDNDMTIGGLSPTGLSGLELDPSMKITIPKDAVYSSITSRLSYDLTDQDPAGSIARVQYYWDERPIGFTYLIVTAVSPDQVMLPAQVSSLAESPAQTDPENLSGQETGSDDVSLSEASGDQAVLPAPASWEGQPAPLSDETDPTEAASLTGTPGIPRFVYLIAGCGAGILLLSAAGIIFVIHSRKKEEEDRLLRRQRRLERLEQAGITPDEFDSMVQRRRSMATQKRGSRLRRYHDDELV